MNTRTYTQTIIANTQKEAEKAALEEVSGYADNFQIGTVTPTKTFEVQVLAWDDPVTDKVGNEINKGDKVLFGSSESVRVGTVDTVARRRVVILAEDTQWPNERTPSNVIVLPANLDTEAVTVPVTIDQLVVGA